MSLFSWDLIKSLGTKYYSLHDKSLHNGNKVCNALSKLKYTMENEDFTSKREEFLCTSVGCQTTLESLIELEAHMTARHTYYCSTCSLILPSHHLLDRHLLETHDSFFHILAQKKPMYACLLESCKLVFQNEVERKEHCMKKHNFPNDFRFDLKWRKLPTQKSRKSKYSSHGKKKQSNNDPDENMIEDNCSTPDMMDITVTEDSQQSNSSKKTKMQENSVKLKIPTTVSFGIGVPRAFYRTCSYKNKQWYQTGQSFKPKTKNISMRDIDDALEIVMSEEKQVKEDMTNE